MSHTPGPWESKRFGDGFVAFAKDGRGHHRRIAYCYAAAFAGRSQQEAKANCRLISAAPDLLKVCKLIVAAQLEARTEEECQRMIARAFDAAQNIIAKAEGRAE